MAAPVGLFMQWRNVKLAFVEQPLFYEINNTSTTVEPTCVARQNTPTLNQKKKEEKHPTTANFSFLALKLGARLLSSRARGVAIGWFKSPYDLKTS